MDDMLIMPYLCIKDMINNYFSKPLQGSIFQLLQNTNIDIMNAEYDKYKME